MAKEGYTAAWYGSAQAAQLYGMGEPFGSDLIDAAKADVVITRKSGQGGAGGA